MPHVEVEPGLSVFAQDLGAGSAVVLVAGFGLSHEVWDGQVQALTAAGHRVVCIDLRGTGSSGKPLAGYDIDRLAMDVQIVLEELDLRDVTLVGWSFGGQVSFRLAATAPERLARLVLVSSNAVRASSSSEFPYGFDADVMEPMLIGAEKGPRVMARTRNMAAGFHGDADPDLIEWLVRIQLQMPSWAAVPCFTTYLRTDLISDIPAVTLPVLQIVGEHDPVTSAEGAPWLTERLAHARLVTIEECGHYPMFEARERFEQELLAFAAGGAP